MNQNERYLLTTLAHVLQGMTFLVMKGEAATPEVAASLQAAVNVWIESANKTAARMIADVTASYEAESRQMDEKDAHRGNGSPPR